MHKFKVTFPTGVSSMRNFINSARTFINSEDAPTMVEYGLMIALIAIVAAVAATLLGKGVGSLFSTVAGSI